MEVQRINRRPMVRTFMDVYRYGKLVCNVCGRTWGPMLPNVGVAVLSDDPNNIRANYVMLLNMEHAVYGPVLAGLMDIHCECGLFAGWHLRNGMHFIPSDHINVRVRPRNHNGRVERLLTDELPWARGV